MEANLTSREQMEQQIEGIRQIILQKKEKGEVFHLGIGDFFAASGLGAQHLARYLQKYHYEVGSLIQPSKPCRNQSPGIAKPSSKQSEIVSRIGEHSNYRQIGLSDDQNQDSEDEEEQFGRNHHNYEQELMNSSYGQFNEQLRQQRQNSN